MSQQIIRNLEKQYMKAEPPKFDIGDTVGVHVRIVEAGKERIQVFTGTVIAVRGRGINRKVTVRRIVAGEGVERVFPIHSPFITRIDVVRSGVTRRAKLYFLRERVGKRTRLKERRVKRREVRVEGEETIAEREARDAEDEAKIRAAEAEAKAKAAAEARARAAEAEAKKEAAKAKRADAETQTAPETAEQADEAAKSD